jgi:hypothetical protein
MRDLILKYPLIGGVKRERKALFGGSVKCRKAISYSGRRQGTGNFSRSMTTHAVADVKEACPWRNFQSVFVILTHETRI